MDTIVTIKSRISLLKALFYKEIVTHYRYMFNTVSELVSFYVIFAFIFFGGRAAGGPAISETLRGLVVGYFLYTAANVAYQGLAGNVMREAQLGTLEQMFVSPHGFGNVMSLKIVVKMAMSFVKAGIILVLMLVTTGTQLVIDIPTILPIGVLAVTSVLGIGFAFAGLALVYKRVNSAFQLVNFIIIGLIGAPLIDVGFMRYLPLALGSSMLQRAMRHGVRLWEFPLSDLVTLVAIAIFYPVVGYAAFQFSQHYARKEGLMGQY